MPLVEVEDIVKHFSVGRSMFRKESKLVRAVDGVSFSLNKGETLGIVGESGCGKSTTGRLVLRLIEPTSGLVKFKGRNILDLDKDGMRKIRPEMQIVHQNPSASLNRRKTARHVLSQPFLIHNLLGRKETESKVLELLEVVGLTPPEQYIDRYPHEFSGGQRQRIALARAIALQPKLIVADEPVSSLDVSIRGQILALMLELQSSLNLAYIFITHDLGVVHSISNRVAIMYLGKIVECSDTSELFQNPLHPYTKALLLAMPIPDPIQTKSRDRIILRSEPPSSVDPPRGCRFHPRCASRYDKCDKMEPELGNCGNDHLVSCHLFN